LKFGLRRAEVPGRGRSLDSHERS